MKLFERNQALEEIFAPANRDWECRRISQLLTPVENAAEQYLWDGEYGEAVDLFLQLVDAMCEHFVTDEHWCWFDDFYWPGDDADGCWEMLRPRLGRMSEEVFDRLEEGLMDLAETEAYEGYGTPGIGKWLADMKAGYAGSLTK
jgi:hypothetical protein